MSENTASDENDVFAAAGNTEKELPEIVRELDESGAYVRHRLSSADAEKDYRNRRIKSFVVREGRLTAGQEHALTEYW